MNRRKGFHFIGTGAAVLGLVLCVPAAMLAQSTNDNSSMAASSNSQDSMGSGMHHHKMKSPEKQLEHLTKRLNLTSQEQQQMLPILQDGHQKAMSIRNNTSLSPQDRRQQMRQCMMDTHQKLEALMTDSQKQQFEQHMQHHRMHKGDMGNGPGPMGNPPPPPDNGTPPPPPPQQ